MTLRTCDDVRTRSGRSHTGWSAGGAARVLAVAAAGAVTVSMGGCTTAAAAPAIDNAFGVGGPALVAEATAIARCESGLNPVAVSPTNDHGLFQINAIHQAQFTRVTGQPWSSVYIAGWNAVYAKWLYDRQGWQPWSCRTVLGR